MLHSHAQTIDDLLSDSLIQALMRADRVEPQSLKNLLGGVASKISAARRARALALKSVRFSGERRLLPPPADLPFSALEWRGNCETGLCG